MVPSSPIRPPRRGLSPTSSLARIRALRVWILPAVLGLVWMLSVPIEAFAEDISVEGRLGWRPLPPELAVQFAQPRETPPQVLRGSLDWRDYGIITPIKNQTICGGCWSFAAIALVEARAIQAGASSSIDLSEQYQLSCDTAEFWGVENDGCCGGTATVFEFLSMNDAVAEADFNWQVGDFDGTGVRSCTASPPWSTVPCPSPHPGGTGIYVDSWSLLSGGVASEAQLKSALQTGPVWLGYYVYSDFETFWNAGSPGDVYSHSSGALLGGHAVLLIGYDDAKSAWLIKNSWGLTGPEGDGTCWVSYTANCDFGTNATSITVTGVSTTLAVCCHADDSCEILSEADCVAAGGTWDESEDSCDPNPCEDPPPLAACCFDDGGCLVRSEAECLAASGTWHEGDASCDPNPCPQPEPTAVCCLPNNTCQVIAEDECSGLGGTWHESLDSCAGVLCANRRVCCFDTNCQILFQDECTAAGGDFWAERTSCNPNPCPTETEKPSWGRMRSLFRPGGGTGQEQSQGEEQSQQARPDPKPGSGQEPEQRPQER